MVDPLPDDAPQFLKDYYAYYKTPRGYHKRSLNSNEGWNVTSSVSFLNMPLLAYSDEIRSAVLLSSTARRPRAISARMPSAAWKGDNKELMIIPARLACRPLRQPRRDTVRPHRGLLPRVSQISGPQRERRGSHLWVAASAFELRVRLRASILGRQHHHGIVVRDGRTVVSRRRAP